MTSRASQRKHVLALEEFVLSWDRFAALGLLRGKAKSPEIEKQFEAARDRCAQARQAIGEVKPT